MPALANTPHRPWLAALLLWAALVAIVSGGFGLAHPPPGSGQLMRWQDAGHDWLLVADADTDQLTVYDAADGRPLQRLGPDAAGGIAAMARRDGHVYLVDDHGTRRELRLPELGMAASRSH